MAIPQPNTVYATPPGTPDESVWVWGLSGGWPAWIRIDQGILPAPSLQDPNLSEQAATAALVLTGSLVFIPIAAAGAKQLQTVKSSSPRKVYQSGQINRIGQQPGWNYVATGPNNYSDIPEIYVSAIPPAG